MAGEEAAAAAAAAAEAAKTAGAAPGVWLTDAKLAPELVGHAQTKGWDKLEPAKAAVAALQAHREAEQRLGVPADRLLKIADPKNPAEVKTMWEKLGAPADPKDYDFSTIKTAAGADIDPKLADALRASAASAFMPKDMAARVADAVVKFNDAKATEEQTLKAGVVETERAELQKNWGDKFEPNKYIAQQGAKKLGFTEAQVKALEDTVGYAKTMEALRRVGQLSGEAKWIQGGGPDNSVMTREQALDAKQKLMSDTAFVTRYNNGDVVAYAEMKALDILITPADK